METHLRSEETLPDFGEEMLRLISPETNNSSSFTALLELPPTQAVELLHSPESEQTPEKAAGGVWGSYPAPRAPVLPANAGLLERASRLSVFAVRREDLSEPLDDLGKVKREPSDFDGSGIDPNVSSSSEPKAAKRKDREKGKDCKKKKSKTISNGCNDGDEKLPYVHVRARRGQATDSHSLAERARREKINARMKLLQELVPGCNKISGTAMVLDEIINHVQSLQRQVEFLSMRLASVNPRIDFDVDSLLAAQANNPMDSNYHGMVMPLMWPDGQLANMTREQQQYPQLCHFEGIHIPEWGREEKPNFITPDNSLLSYVSPTNSGSLHLNHLKKET